jgi:ADP-heptose:LPS heptosyltransferase
MGDVAMSAPIIRELKSKNPELKITILTRAFFKPFFRDIENVHVFEADLKGRHKGVLGLYRLSKELKKLQIDAVADLHNVLRSNILKLFINGIPFVQIDKGRANKKALTSGKIFKQLKTTHQRYTDVFSQLGFKLNINKPIFSKKVELNAKLNNIISNSKSNIGIAPFAAFQSKAYPLGLMEQVISELSKTKNILLFGGGASETEILNSIETKYDNVTSLAGKLSLDEELDIISNLDVMVAMDSGNAHIAAMLGIQVVTLWGVTHPYAGFYPFNQDIKNALLANREMYPLIPTSIYGNKFPEGYEDAIASIQPDKLIEKINEVQKKALQ